MWVPHLCCRACGSVFNETCAQLEITYSFHLQQDLHVLSADIETLLPRFHDKQYRNGNSHGFYVGFTDEHTYDGVGSHSIARWPRHGPL